MDTMPMSDRGCFFKLQETFFREPECTELHSEIDRSLQALRQQLGKEQRKKLLRIIDAEAALQDEISLAAFIAGFRLAHKIEAELAANMAHT